VSNFLRPPQWRSLPRVLPAVLLAGVLVAVPVSGQGDLEMLFARGRYAEARSLLSDGVVDYPRPGEELLWHLRLETDPEAAVSLARSGLANFNIPAGPRLGCALLVASVEFGRGDHPAVLRVLLPLLDGPEAAVAPGQAYLLAGLAYRSLGDSRRAREMFATVKLDDPAFGRARYLLGLVAMEGGDNVLALRYFESAERGAATDVLPDLLAGRWYALRADGRAAEAAAIRSRLLDEAPLSLAALTVRVPEKTDGSPPPPVDTVATTVRRTESASARYSVQLAAYSDRALALASLARWREFLPDLRIDAETDNRGQLLYKVRTGHFTTPVQARDEARRVGSRLRLETIVVEASP